MRHHEELLAISFSASDDPEPLVTQFDECIKAIAASGAGPLDDQHAKRQLLSALDPEFYKEVITPLRLDTELDKVTIEEIYTHVCEVWWCAHPEGPTTRQPLSLPLTAAYAGKDAPGADFLSEFDRVLREAFQLLDALRSSARDPVPEPPPPRHDPRDRDRRTVTNYTSAADVDSTWTLSMTGVPSSSAGATLDWSLTGPDLVCNDVGCFLQFCGFAVDTYTLTGSISVFGVAAQQTSGLLYVINAPPPPPPSPSPPRSASTAPYPPPSPPPPPPADVYEVAATILLSKVEMSDMDNDEFATNMTTYFAADLMNMLEIFYSAGSVVASVTLQFAGTDYTSALNYYTSLSADNDLTLTLVDAFWDSFLSPHRADAEVVWTEMYADVSEGDLPPLQVVTELEYEEEDEAVGLALEVDVMPPVMILLGAPYVEVLVRETYIDAGAMAEDLRDGFVPAVAVQREVTVVSPCTAPSYVCEEPITEYLCATCDEGLDGNVTCVCLAFLSSSYSISTYDVTEYAPAEDVTPPVIAMLPGDGVLALTTGGAWVYVHRVLLGSGPFEDPGATAWDNVQGDLTASITR
ncbi:hypothetical protein CYMTET_28985, partial [Cymbomonas tetramitiformis]